MSNKVSLSDQIREVIEDPSKVSRGSLESLIPDQGELWFQENSRMILGDHWLDGDGWVGPSAPPDDAEYREIMALIKRGFTFSNILAEIVNRASAAVFAQIPSWVLSEVEAQSSLLPEGSFEEGVLQDQLPEENLVEEADDLIRRWLDSQQGIISETREETSPLVVIQRALWNAFWCTRGPLRFFIPASRLNEEMTALKDNDPEFVLQSIFLHAPPPGVATVTVDYDRMDRLGLYVTEDMADISYRDPATGDVVFGHYDFSQTSEFNEEDLGGGQDYIEIVIPSLRRLWMFEMSVPRLVTDAVRQMQKQYNMSLTMMGRNMVQAGFLERTVLNATKPEKIEISSSGERVLEEGDLILGPGRTTFLYGYEYEDETGKIQVANPNVIYRDPVPSATFIETKQAQKADILEEAQQAHVLTISEAALSGKSRQEARHDFEVFINSPSRQVEAAIRWALTGFLDLVAYFTGTPDKYKSLRIKAEAHPSSGILLPEEIQSVIQLYDSKLLSRRSAMIRTGIEDVQSEEDQLEEDQERAQQAQQEQLASALLRAQLNPTQSGFATSAQENLSPEEDEEGESNVNQSTPPGTGTVANQ